MPSSGSVAVPLSLALLSSALITLSFPSPDQGWLAWVALVPLLLGCRGLRPRAAFGLGFLTGLGATAGTFAWIFEVPGFGVHHFLLCAAYLALYPAFWCAGVSRLTRGRLPLALTAPALWVALDYLRAHNGFLAFPWASLAHSQHRNLAVLQVAAIAGEYGIVFLVVLGSLVIADVMAGRRWRSAGVGALAILMVHAWGAIALGRQPAEATLRVAAIQPSIRREEQTSEGGRAAAFDRLARLSRSAAAGRPALIAWPESAVYRLAYDRSLATRLLEVVQDLGTPLVVGSSEAAKFSAAGDQVPLGRRNYTTAFYLEPGKPIGASYQKMLLVPFGEYTPLAGMVRWPAWLLPMVYDITPGQARVLFALPDGTRFATVICWENLFGSFVRASVRDGAQLIVQLTNDNWFGPTAAPRQHDLASVLRAVENRVPVVIASNTGPSEIIDPFGRVLGAGPEPFEAGLAAAEVPLANERTVYTRAGDLFAIACVAIALLGFARGAASRPAFGPDCARTPGSKAGNTVTGRAALDDGDK